MIDEAHLLSPEQLEEIRLLSNADLDSALDGLISGRYHIGGMDLTESVGYLRHHLAHALLTARLAHRR